MRHLVDGKKLGRTTSHRKAMFANMATSLIMHNRIETTLPKAKELKPLADKLITMGKKKTLAARRRAISIIRDKKAVHKLFEEIALRFADRNGGYTRILKLGSRHGDAAPMAVVEYLHAEKHHAAADEHHGGGKTEPKHEKAESEEKKAREKKGSHVLAKFIGKKKDAVKKLVDTKHKRSSPTHKATRGE